MDNGLSASDVALMNRDTGFGGDGFAWIFGLLILMGMFNGNGWGGNGYHPQYATQDFVQNGFNFNSLIDGNRDLMGAINSGAAQAVAATNQAKYDNINVAKDIQSALSTQIAGLGVGQAQLLANQNECCCSTKMLIQESTSKILDAMAQNKIESLQQQVNALQLKAATEGMLRYPNTWTWNAGTFPPVTTTTPSTGA